MSLLPKILAEIISDYFEGETKSGRECRIVAPGLTRKIAPTIHQILRDKGIVSYLVVAKEMTPEKKKAWITPVGLTSQRIGSFVAVTCPGQLAQIQDSIRGSGGAIRSVVYSEEWPWIDDRSESFQFDGPVIERLVRAWTADEEARKWLHEFVIYGLVPSTRSASNRGSLLLDEILGTFHPSIYPKIDDVRLKMLYHTGMAYTGDDISDVKRFLKGRIKSCQQIVERCRKEENVRASVLDRIPDLIDEPYRDEVTTTLNGFLDRIGRSETLDQGLLSFFGCWGEDTARWRYIPNHILEQLFDVEDRDPAEVSYSISCNRCVKSDTGKTIALFYGQPLAIDVKYSIPEQDLERLRWTLRISHRRQALNSAEITSATGSTIFTVESSSFASTKRPVPLRISLHADDDVRADDKLKLHYCGPDRPAFVLIERTFDIIDAHVRDDDESPDKKIEIDVPSHIFIFAYELGEPTMMDEDEIEQPIVSIEEPGIWRSGDRVDPIEVASGQAVRVVTFGELTAVTSLEARDIERGSFTIEDELRIQIRKGRKEELGHLLDIFAGLSDEPYYRLGGLDAQARGRIRLAADMTGERGWRPLLTDLLDGNFGEGDAIGDFIVSRGAVESSGFTNLKMPQEAIELIRAYSSCRKSVLDVVRESLDVGNNQLEHPLYASHPIFVDNSSGDVEQLLLEFLRAYDSILRYVVEERTDLDWSQMFVLMYLDCVIHWADSPFRNTFILIGPWHPLVLSKRFMVQSLIFERARGLALSDGKRFRFLAELLKDIHGFRWFPGLHPDDSILDPLYTIGTSDPGWHLAIRKDLETIVGRSGEGTISNLLEIVYRNIGIKVDVFEGKLEDLVRSSLTDFARAYPTRRSLSLKIRDCYSIHRVSSSIDSILHHEDKPTEFGSRIPGGVHVYTDEASSKVTADFSTGPPLQIYHASAADPCATPHPDMVILAPSQGLNFISTEYEYPMSRGLGMKAVLSEPVTWLTSGQSQLPVTITLERDLDTLDGQGLGGEFVSIQSRIFKETSNCLALLRSADLPKRLDSPWAVFPGANIDPAVFVRYVIDGSEREIEDRALWDFRVDLSGAKDTFYVLSKIPRGFQIAVNGFFEKNDLASEFLQELGSLGVAIGGEALKSGRRAHGVIGLVGALRMVAGWESKRTGAIICRNRCIGFIIPVDSFQSFFTKRTDPKSDDTTISQRTDLLAIQMLLPTDGQSELIISSCGVESKFVSHRFSTDLARSAMKQAKASNDSFAELVCTSSQDWATPERLALLLLVKFGLRVSSASIECKEDEWLKKECTVARLILQGKYQYQSANQSAIVISTEAGLPGVAESNKLDDGLWVRLNRRDWPGVSDSGRLNEIRQEIESIFDIPDDCIENNEVDDSAHQDGKSVVKSVVEEKETLDERDTEGSVLQPNEEDLTSKEEGVDEGSRSEADNDNGMNSLVLDKIFLGVDDGRRPVYYDPQSPVDRLDNLNVMITGSSGSGKTQLLKYLVCKIREQAQNVLLLDFKKDFCDDATFIRMAEVSPVYVSFDGLPFNPLIPYPIRHPVSGERVIQIGQHISGIASVLKRTYRLGAQQQIAVKNAITDAFEAVGIPSSGTSPYNESMQFPDFSSVGERLQATNQQAYNRLDPLFTLDLFRLVERKCSFESLVHRSMILDFSQIPNDEIKNTLSELLVLSAHAYYNAQPHSGSIRQYLVFDEAHRVLESAFMIDMVRECRAYGVGTILSSQYPTDFPAEISSSVATKILHGNGRDADRVKTIIQLIGGSGREGDVANLARFQAFLDNRHFPHSLIRTMNYPLYIIWSNLQRHGDLSVEELSTLEGVDPDKLPVVDLVRQLENLGLIEVRGGIIRRFERDGS